MKMEYLVVTSVGRRYGLNIVSNFSIAAKCLVITVIELDMRKLTQVKIYSGVRNVISNLHKNQT